jgi:hypothetical protein
MRPQRALAAVEQRRSSFGGPGALVGDFDLGVLARFF